MLGGAPVLVFQSVTLGLSVAPSLDGVTHVAVIADPVARGGMLRRKVMPLLLPRLGTLGTHQLDFLQEVS